MTRVLVIDDEPEIAPLVSLCLDYLDIEVVLAENRAAALRVARADPIGLVLLDLSLGDEDGLEILPDLRREPNLSGIPIVAFTAHGSRKSEAFGSGVDSFLARPFLASDLRSTVELHLAR